MELKPLLQSTWLGSHNKVRKHVEIKPVASHALSIKWNVGWQLPREQLAKIHGREPMLHCRHLSH